MRKARCCLFTQWGKFQESIGAASKSAPTSGPERNLLFIILTVNQSAPKGDSLYLPRLPAMQNVLKGSFRKQTTLGRLPEGKGDGERMKRIKGVKCMGME